MVNLFFILVLGGARLSKQHPQKKRPDNQDIEMRSTQKTEVIRSRHRHITLMLLAVAVVFLLLTLPNSIYFVLDLTYGFNKFPAVNDYYQWLRYRRLTILTVIMFQLSDLQHATNFFLYLLTSDKFRRSVVRICVSTMPILPSLFPCCCRDKARLSTTSLASQYMSQKHDKMQMSFRSSVSVGRLSMPINTHRGSLRPTSQPLYKYRSLPSKAVTSTTASESA